MEFDIPPEQVDPRGPLSEAQLAESVARLKSADADIDAGNGMEIIAAFEAIARKNGLPWQYP